MRVPEPVATFYKRLMPKTSVVTLAELLAGLGSKLGELTTAVFVADDGIGSFEIRTVKLMVVEAPLGKLPRLQVMVPPCARGGVVQEAPPAFIDKKIAGAGSGLTNVTAEAGNGPRLVTVTV